MAYVAVGAHEAVGAYVCASVGVYAPVYNHVFANYGVVAYLAV